MFSFLYVFVRSVGLSFRDIKKVYVAGALGCGIDPEKAITIGMLPDIPRERFLPLGNSSIGGAAEVLLQRGLLKEVEDIASKITYREMNEDAELMHVLQGAMFIPHTAPEILKGYTLSRDWQAELNITLSHSSDETRACSHVLYAGCSVKYD